MKQRNQVMLSVLAAVVCLFVGGLSAHATPITVPNYSFEANPVPVGEWIVGPITDWTWAAEGTSPNDTLVVANGTGITGVDAANFFVVRFSATAYPGALTYPTLLETVSAAGETYTLTVAAGRSTATAEDSGGIGLTIAGAPVAFTAVPGIAGVSVGKLTDYTVQYKTTAADIGKSLSVALTGAPSDDSQIWFDNVRLDVVVPEPASLALLAVAGAALGARRRR